MHIIEVKNVTVNAKNKQWTAFTILEQISFNVKKWEIFAFIGPNGAGKSTSIRTILWLQAFSSGEITLFWEPLKTHNNYKKNIGYAPDQAIFYTHFTAKEHLKFFSRLWWTTLSDTKAQQLLQLVGLEHTNKTYVKDFSQGMKQRLGLAISLTNDPELLVWDEPMNGLDPLGRKQVKTLIKTLQGQGKTIFFSTHILTDVEELADRFGLIHQWKILTQKQVKDIQGSLEDFFIKQTTQII